MTDDGRFFRLLDEVLDEPPKAAPDRLLTAVLNGDGLGSQRVGRSWARASRLGMGLSTRRLAVGLAVAAVVVAIVSGQIVPRLSVNGPPAGDSPSPAPSNTAQPSAAAGAAYALEEGTGKLLSGVTYTSNQFSPRVTFRLKAFGIRSEDGETTDWCDPWQADNPAPDPTPRSLVLAWLAGCVTDLRFIRPYSVDCGTPSSHPDAATLAMAILANPGLPSQDQGTLEPGPDIPAALFTDSYPGRSVKVTASRPFDASATDPDHCRLLPEPGSPDPVIEVRGDMTARLILMDLGGELVVLRIANAGYDAATGAAARARGYGQGSSGSSLCCYLDAIYDIHFDAPSTR